MKGTFDWRAFGLLFQLAFFLLPLSLSSQVLPFNHGLKWGWVRMDGQVLVHPRFARVVEISREWALGFESGPKWHRVSLLSGELFPLEAEEVSLLPAPEGGILQILTDGKVGLMMPEGRAILPVCYDGIRELGNEVLETKKGEFRGAYFLRNDNEIPARYDSLYWEGEWLMGKTRGETVIWDTLGWEMGRLPFSDFQLLFPGRLLVRQEAGWHLADWDGHILSDTPFFQWVVDSAGYFWVKTGEGWGLWDLEGREIIPPVLACSGSFRGKVAPVKVGEKMGLVNGAGEWLAPPRYDQIRVYLRFARLLRDSTWTQVTFDERGQQTHEYRVLVAGKRKEPPKPAIQVANSRNVVDFSSYGWQYRSGHWAWNREGGNPHHFGGQIEEVWPYPHYGLTVAGGYEYGTNNPWRDWHCLIDHQNGKVLLQPFGGILHRNDFLRYPVARAIQMVDWEIALFFLVDYRGRVRRYPKVTQWGEIQHGWIPAKSKQGWGLLNLRGEWVRDLGCFEELGKFEQGYAWFKQEGKWGLMDSLLRELVPPTYDWIKEGSIPGFLLAGRKGSRFSYLDSMGNRLFSWEGVESGNFSEGRVRVKTKEGHWGFLDQSGREVVPASYRGAGDFSGGRAPVHGEKKWGYVGVNGDTLIPFQYDDAASFTVGRARVKQERRVGYIDREGRWVFRPKLRRGEDFGRDGMAIVRLEGWGVLDSTGHWVLRPRFRQVKRAGEFLLARQKGSWEVFDRRGNKLQAAKLPGAPSVKTPVDTQVSEIRRWGFAQVGPLKEGIRVARANQLWGLLDPTGEEVLPLEFELIRKKGGVFQVMSGGQMGYFHPEGRWVLPLDKGVK